VKQPKQSHEVLEKEIAALPSVTRALKDDVVILRKCPWGAMTRELNKINERRFLKSFETAKEWYFCVSDYSITHFFYIHVPDGCIRRQCFNPAS
jgi:hypothetical protein